MKHKKPKRKHPPLALFFLLGLGGVATLLFLFLILHSLFETPPPPPLPPPTPQVLQQPALSITRNEELLLRLEEMIGQQQQQMNAQQALDANDTNGTSYAELTPKTEVIIAPKEPPRHTPVAPKEWTKKPKLAIIMDDIGYLWQAKELLELGFKVTPSVFPQSAKTPDTPKIASLLPFYMIHIPLEAIEFYQKGQEWFFVHDTPEALEQKFQKIVRDFPTMKYLNNHTGSKFTADIPAMRRLYELIGSRGFVFVDSRTTAESKAPVVAKERKKPLLSRDVFLDNSRDESAIRRQIIEAVGIAKKRGYAVAIGHPHPETFRALKGAKQLFDGVDLVYVDEIYKALSFKE